MAELAKIDTILVATDFSATAGNAVGWAARIARLHGARLVLYHGAPATAPPLASPGPRVLGGGSAWEKWREARARLGEMAGAIRTRNIDVTTDLQTDLGAETILRRAAAHGADLVVAGTRGMSRSKKVLLGSTATTLIRDADVPVLTVPPLARESRPIRRVLVPTDFSTDLQATVRDLEHLLGSHACHADVTLLHVYAAPYQPASPWSAPLVLGPRQTGSLSALRRLERTATRLDHRLHRIDTVACGGDPARAIDREAQSLEADLIVMGHGRSPQSRLLRSATAERVLAAAPCPVLTIHQETRARASVARTTRPEKPLSASKAARCRGRTRASRADPHPESR